AVEPETSAPRTDHPEPANQFAHPELPAQLRGLYSDAWRIARNSDGSGTAVDDSPSERRKKGQKKPFPGPPRKQSFSPGRPARKGLRVQSRGRSRPLWPARTARRAGEVAGDVLRGPGLDVGLPEEAQVPGTVDEAELPGAEGIEVRAV